MDCCRKQYSIDELEGNKILRRRPGVTTKTCIKVASVPQANNSGKLEAPEVSLPVTSLCSVLTLGSKATRQYSPADLI